METKSKKNSHPNIVKGKIRCGICDCVMYQKVNPDARIDLFYCKNGKCKNTINRTWLFEMVKLAVTEHVNLDTEKKHFNEIIKLLDKELDIAIKRIRLKKAHLKRAYEDKFEYVNNLGDFEFNKTIKKYKQELQELEIAYSKLKKNRDDTMSGFEYVIKNTTDNRKRLKSRIKTMLQDITVEKNEVILNIMGWRFYDIPKPYSYSLAWHKRDKRDFEYTLPSCRYQTGDNDLDALIHGYLNELDS